MRKTSVIPQGPVCRLAPAAGMDWVCEQFPTRFDLLITKHFAVRLKNVIPVWEFPVDKA